MKAFGIPFAIALLALAGCEDGGGTLGPGLGGGGLDDDDTPDIPPEDQDNDGDGFTPNEGDCDDDDPDSNPDGEEGDVADGADNDCNGTADDQTVGECEGHVQDYETIQAGIDGAPNRFVLLVCPGVYPENLTANANDVTVRAIEGPDETSIEAGGARALVVGGNIDFTLDGFTVTGGYAENGGAILCNGADLSLFGNVIEDNEAFAADGLPGGHGGALYADQCALTIDSNTFADNVASAHGGAAFVTRTGGVIGNSTWDGNTALDGGALFVDGGGSTITGNEFTNNNATTISEESYSTGSGGGAVWISGNPTFTDNVVASNTSQYNGGGVWIKDGTGDFLNNTIENNLSVEDGGGVYTRVSRNLIQGNSFLNNVAQDDAGGLRVYVGRHSIDDNTFIGNSAGDDGGGLKMSHSTNAVSNSYFEGNSASDVGGGVELDNETAPVSGCTFIGNTAGRGGGGLHSWRNEGQIALTDLLFQGNSAGCGGAMAFDNDRYLVTVSDVWVEGNNAQDGGGFCIDRQPQKGPDDELNTEDDIYHESNVLVRNSFFVDNDASDDAGFAYVKFGDASFDFVVAHRSDAPNGGALFAKPEGHIVVRNSIIDDNDGNSAFATEEDGTITFAYNNLTGNNGGFTGAGVSDPVGTAGNISVDSGFVDAAGGDYNLAPGSQCIDAADPSLSDRDGTTADMGGYGGPNGQ